MTNGTNILSLFLIKLSRIEKGWLRMICVENIAKRFGKHEVLSDITFNIERGICTAFIGKNGAGKSTLIDIIVGNKQIDTGRIVDEDNLLNSQRMAILFQKTQFPKMLKVRELFELHQSFYKKVISIERFQEITQFDTRQLEQMADSLSGGQKRILDFALTLVGLPEFLIMDEPTTAMDIETREHFWKIIADLKLKGMTILYTSHYIEEVERMADHVILLDRGVIQISDTPENIRTNGSHSIVNIPKYYYEIIENISNEYKITKNGQYYKIETDDVKEVINYLIQQDVNLNDIEIHKSSLLEIMFSDKEQDGVVAK